MSVPAIKVRRLTDKDDVQSFNCGPNEWDTDVADFLKEDALIQQHMGMNVTSLFYSDSKLVAFVSLTASQVKLEHGSSWRTWCRLEAVQYLQVPCILIARFAVVQSMQRQGIGRFMLSWIRGAALSIDVGVKLLTLHVHNDNKAGLSFWESQGFAIFEPAKTKTHTYMLHDLYSVGL